MGEGKASLIFREIRQKFGIGYHIGFKFHKLRRQSHAYLYLSCFDFDKEKVLKAKNEFLFIINQIKEFGVSPEDLNRAKIYIITQYNIENLNLINKAHNIAWNDAICGDYKRFFSFENDINKITNDDVKNVVNKYFTEYCEIISQPIDKNE